MSWALANLILAAALAGLIWTVQLVLYPLFALVGASEWERNIAAPLHGRVEHAASKRTVGLLVRANWLRTIAWTVQVVCAVALM